jgi:hypothetical protein
VELRVCGLRLRRRCRSIPTTCRPSYASVIVGLLFPGGDGCLNNLQHPPGAEARSFIASLAFRPSQSRACPRPLARSGRRPPSSGHLRGAHGPHQLAVRVQEVPEPDQKDLRAACTAPTEAAAGQRFAEFEAAWGRPVADDHPAVALNLAAVHPVPTRGSRPYPIGCGSHVEEP